MFKNVYSFYPAFCTQPAFYSQSAVCILHSVCILPLVRSLQSAVCSPQSAFHTDRLSIQQSIDVRFNVTDSPHPFPPRKLVECHIVNKFRY